MNLRHILQSMFRHWIRTPQPQTTRRPKKVGLTFESLDERVLPSITFGASANGTWAVDSNTGATKQVTSAVPSAMTEGSDGTLFATYPNGTWEYNYANNNMTQLTPGTATAMSASSDNTLVASYGWGTWQYANGGQRPVRCLRRHSGRQLPLGHLPEQRRAVAAALVGARDAGGRGRQGPGLCDVWLGHLRIER
jgi:hypothetical protein